MTTEEKGTSDEASQPAATNDDDGEGRAAATSSAAAVNCVDCDDGGPEDEKVELSRRSPSQMGGRREFDDDDGGGGSESSSEAATSMTPARTGRGRGLDDGEKRGDRPSPPIVRSDSGGIRNDDGVSSEGDGDCGDSEGDDRMARGFASFLLGDLVPYFFAPVSLFRSSSSLSSGSSDIDDYIRRMDDLLPEDGLTKVELERSSESRRRSKSSMEMASASRSSSSRDDDSDPPPPFPFVNVRHRDLHHSSGDDEDEDVVQSDLDDFSSSSCDDEEDVASSSASPALVVRLSELLNSAYGPCSNASEQTDRVLTLLDAYRGRDERDRLINLLEIKACSVRMSEGVTKTTRTTTGTSTAPGDGGRLDDSDRGVGHGDPTFVKRVSELIRYVYGPAKETSNREEDEGSRCCSTETSGCGFEFGAMAGAEVDRLAAVLRCYAGREPVLLHRLEARALKKASMAGDGAATDAARRSRLEVCPGDDTELGEEEPHPRSTGGEMEAVAAASSSNVPRRSLAEFFRERRRRGRGAAAAMEEAPSSSSGGSPMRRPPTMTSTDTDDIAAPDDDLPDVCCSQSAATEPASNVSPRSIATEATTVVAGPWTEECRAPVPSASAPVTTATETDHPHQPQSVEMKDFEREAVVPQAPRSPSRTKRFDDMDAVGSGFVGTDEHGPMGRWMTTSRRPSSSTSTSAPSSPASSSTDTSMSTVVSSGSASSDDDGGDDAVIAGIADAKRRRKLKDRGGRMGRRMSAKAAAAAAASGSVLKLLRGKSRGRSFTHRR